MKLNIKEELKSYTSKAPKTKTTIHWWNLYPIRSVQLTPRVQVEITKSAIKKAGSQTKLAIVLNVKQATISKWILLKRNIFIYNLINLCHFVGYPLNRIERNITKISGLKNPQLPFDLASPESIKIRAAFLSDGHIPGKITDAPHYKSNAIEAHKNLILRCKKVFGNFKVQTRYIKK